MDYSPYISIGCKSRSDHEPSRTPKLVVYNLGFRFRPKTHPKLGRFKHRSIHRWPMKADSAQALLCILVKWMVWWPTGWVKSCDVLRGVTEIQSIADAKGREWAIFPLRFWSSYLLTGYDISKAHQYSTNQVIQAATFLSPFLNGWKWWKTNFSLVMIWNHPFEINTQNWLFRVPGTYLSLYNIRWHIYIYVHTVHT